MAAAGYDARHAGRRSLAKARVIDAPQRASARGARRVLELGCGTGRLLAEIPAPVTVGVDVAHEMVRQAARRGLPAARADAHRLPFSAGGFGAILAGKGVFRYLDYPRAFAESARVLQPGGRLAVHQYAARPWTLRRGAGAGRADALHVRHLDELREPAEGAGLTVETIHLWRGVRVPPYAVAVPRWLPGRLWTECVIVFRKPGGGERRGAARPHREW